MNISEAPAALADFKARWAAGQYTEAISQARALSLIVTDTDCDFSLLEKFEATQTDPFSRAHARLTSPSLYDLRVARAMVGSKR